MDSIIKEKSNEYFIKLEIEEISNILNNFEVLKRLNLLNHDEEVRETLFNRFDMEFFFGPLLAGIISKKSKLINMDEKDLRKFKRKFNSIFPIKYSSIINYYEYLYKEEFRKTIIKMKKTINKFHKSKKFAFNNPMNKVA